MPCRDSRDRVEKFAKVTFNGWPYRFVPLESEPAFCEVCGFEFFSVVCARCRQGNLIPFGSAVKNDVARMVYSCFHCKYDTVLIFAWKGDRVAPVNAYYCPEKWRHNV